MQLLNKIKVDQLIARKERDSIKSNILTYIMGEVGRLPKKDESDAKVQSVVKKIKKNLEDSLKVKYDTTMHNEVCILSSYLPENITGIELSNTIQLAIGSLDKPNIGSVMKELKQRALDGNFDYDGKEASTIIKEML